MLRFNIIILLTSFCAITHNHSPIHTIRGTMPPSEGIVNWLTVDEIDNVEEEVGQQDPVDNGAA